MVKMAIGSLKILFAKIFYISPINISSFIQIYLLIHPNLFFHTTHKQLSHLSKNFLVNKS